VNRTLGSAQLDLFRAVFAISNICSAVLAHAVNHQTLPALPLLPPVLADAAAMALLAVALAPAVRADARAAALLAVVPQPVMLANAAAVALLAPAPLSAVLADTGQVLTRLWLLDARALQLLS
jgi:hypothetical protein